MTKDDFWRLVVLSIREPRAAARIVTGYSDQREVLWTAGALVVVLNSLVYGLSQVAYGAQTPVISLGPGLFALLLAATLPLIAFAFSAVGRLMGGQASMAQVATVLIWLQGLRALAQMVILLMLLVSPALSGLMVLAVVALGFYMTLMFIDEAHRFYNLFATAGTLILGVIGLGVALSLLLGVAGVSPTGISGNV